MWIAYALPFLFILGVKKTKESKHTCVVLYLKVYCVDTPQQDPRLWILGLQ